MPQDAVAMVRACHRTYVEQDRPAIEALPAAAFRFSSPRDNRIDRAVYFARCWPHGRAGARGCEVFAIAGSRIEAVDGCFGWSLPHAAAGSFLD